MFTLLRKVRLVGDLGGVRQQFADPGARLAVLREGELRGHHRETGLRGRHAGEPLAVADGLRQIGALEFAEARLVVEEFHLRRPAGLEEIDHAFGGGREMGQTAESAVSRGARVAAAEAGQGGQADARGIHTEEVPPGYSFMFIPY